MKTTEYIHPTTFHNDGDMNVSAPNGKVVAPGDYIQMPGLSLRDYFAAKAMQGMLASGRWDVVGASIIANESYEIADAMLGERA